VVAGREKEGEHKTSTKIAKYITKVGQDMEWKVSILVRCPY
jgi:hypothetical protein